jgi:hypothetical protein
MDTWQINRLPGGKAMKKYKFEAKIEAGEGGGLSGFSV